MKWKGWKKMKKRIGNGKEVDEKELLKQLWSWAFWVIVVKNVKYFIWIWWWA